MGPKLIFNQNKLANCHSGNELISLFGVQQSFITNNLFTDCNKDKTLIAYQDIVRAAHLLRDNTMINSGAIKPNQYVTNQQNSIK